MINIINKLSSFLFNRSNKIKNNKIRQKKYDEAKVNKQKLYEKWCKKEKWLLFNEGILLLLSIDPSKNDILDNEIIQRVNDLKTHATECVKKNLLSVENINKAESNWKVKPVDLYRWATISRISIPDEFNALMIFITQTIKVNIQEGNFVDFENSEDQLHQNENEIILGATMSFLINSPDICRNNDGNIDYKKAVSRIIENKKHWFGNDKQNISERKMINLIEKYVRISKVTR
tara:strand:- start:214 stop:912 length:699 start_codon:yes stop_codon:yes gene_type:complete